MSQVEARWLLKDANSLEADANNNLKVKLNNTRLLEATSSGVGIIPNTVIEPNGNVAFTGSQSMGNHNLHDLAAPTTETDATTKIYVDDLFQQATTRATHIEQITLTSTHVGNKYVTLAYTPLGTSDISLTIAQGGIQFYNLDFVLVNGNQLSWAGKGLDGVLVSGDTMIVTYVREIGIITGTSSHSTKTHTTLPVNTFAPDDTKIGVAPYHFLNKFDAMKYAAATDGALWFTLPITPAFVYNTDVIFDLVFAVTVADNTAGNAIRMSVELYKTMTGQSVTTPTYTAHDDIIPGTLAANTLGRFTTVSIKIPWDTINVDTAAYAVKLWRDTSIANNYNSEFVLVSMTPRQVV